MELTQYYQLKKPGLEDSVLVGDLNENADAIDAAIHGLGEEMAVALAGKQAAVTGGASSITTSNLTASRALVSDAAGKVAASAVTAAELGYLDGVTSAIQTQLNAKAASSHNHAAGNITSGTLPVARGGTGLTAAPSVLVNLASAAAASALTASPRPGVTGVLPVANGGTGQTSLANLAAQLVGQGMTKIATGSYTGTGTCGESSPNSLTFAFAQKFVFVYCVGFYHDTLGGLINAFDGLFFTGYGACMLQEISNMAIHATFSEKKIQWYTDHARIQLNQSGYTYAYVALG